MALSAIGAAAGCASGPGRGARTGRAVVIGAGFAGLSAADRLQRDGWDVLVLEARGRVGGRVLRVDGLSDAGAYAEGGGEWIGLNHPRWLAYAERFGLRLIEATDEDGNAPVVLGGRRLTEHETEALYTELDGHTAALTEAATRIRAEAPWNSPDAAALDAASVASWLEQREMSGVCREAAVSMLEHDNAAPVGAMSLLGLLSMIAGGGGQSFWTDSEVYRCRGGNAGLAENLAEALGPSQLRLREPAVGVAVGDDGCRVATERETYLADAVVLATPPSVWGRLPITGPGGDRISPPAPRMGPAVKLLACVSRPWWRDGGLSPDGLGDGVVGYTWNATDGQTVTRPIICAFGAGPAATDMPAGNPSPMREGIERLLPGFFGVRAAESERLMDWPRDTWAGAGYSFPAPGEVTTVVRTLRAGLRAGGRTRLAFAGEHLSAGFVGYMEGALQSGHLAAGLLTA